MVIRSLISRIRRRKPGKRICNSTHVTEMPPPSSLLPAVGLKLTVWSSAAKTHSILTVLSVSWKIIQ